MGNLIYRGALGLTEQADSPVWTFDSEGVRVLRRLRGLYSVAFSSAPGYGILGTGPYAGLRVKSSTVEHERGGTGLLTIEYGPVEGEQYANAQLPEDEEELIGGDQEFSLFDHPFYADLTANQSTDINTVLQTSWEDQRHQAALLRLATDALALELLGRLQRGFTIYKEYAPMLQQVIYSWLPPAQPNPGGRVEVPTPIRVSLPAGFEWVRFSDSVSWTGAHYRTVKRWQAGKGVEDIYKR